MIAEFNNGASAGTASEALVASFEHIVFKNREPEIAQLIQNKPPPTFYLTLTFK